MCQYHLQLTTVDFGAMDEVPEVSIPIIDVLKVTLENCPVLKYLDVGCGWRVPEGEAGLRDFRTVLTSLRIVCWRTLHTFKLQQSMNSRISSRLLTQTDFDAHQARISREVNMIPAAEHWCHLLSQMPALRELDLRRYAFASFHADLIETVARTCLHLEHLHLSHDVRFTARNMIPRYNNVHAVYRLAQLMLLRRRTLLTLETPILSCTVIGMVDVAGTTTEYDMEAILEEFKDTLPAFAVHSGISRLSREDLPVFDTTQAFYEELRGRGDNVLECLLVTGTALSANVMHAITCDKPVFPELCELGLVASEVPDLLMAQIPDRLGRNLPHLQHLGLESFASDFPIGAFVSEVCSESRSLDSLSLVNVEGAQRVLLETYLRPPHISVQAGYNMRPFLSEHGF